MASQPSLPRRAVAEVAPHRRAVTWSASAALVWAVWVSGPGWATPAVVVAACAGAALWVIDARTHRLPNAITYPTTAVVAVLFALAALVSGDADSAWGALLGALALGGAYLGLYVLGLLFRSQGLGLGDVKLAVLIGLVTGWFGWGVLWTATVLTILGAGLVAAGLMITRRASRTSAMAFGPYMLAGAVLALSLARVVDLA